MHPEILRSEELPDAAGRRMPSGEDRYRSIVDLESHLYGNGTRIVKFFLHLSKDEQRKRFLAAHRRAGEELEVQHGRYRGAQILEAVHERL